MKQPINPKVAKKEKEATKTEKKAKKGWREETDPYKKYKKYIGSKEWKEACEYIYTNVYLKKCYFCGREEGEDGASIQLHHNSYSHLFNEKEHPECVIPICASCHRHLHRLRTNWKRFKRN